jgi:DNA-binding transcriptional regulator YiaG
VFSNHTDEQISRALRDKLELLQPDEIRASREGLHLTQKVLAQRIGVAPETISRWESGLLIQSRAMNTLLRLFFEVPEARGVLGAECGTLGFLDSLTDWTAEASLAYAAVLEPIPQLSGVAPGQGGFARFDRLWDGLLVDPKTCLPAMTGFPVAGTVTFDVAVSPQWPIVGEGDRLAAAASEVLAETSSRIAA